MRRAVLIGLLAAFPSVASAQVVEPRSFSAERFALSLDRSGILNVEWADVPDDFAFDVSLWLGVADDPLTFQRTNANGTTRVGSLVQTRVGGGLALALAFDARVQVGVEVPLILHQNRDATVVGVAGPLDSLSGGIGAPRVAAKVHLVEQSDLGVHLTLMPAFSIPVSRQAEYAGQDALVFEPALLLARVQGNLRVGANVGVRVRPSETYLDLEVDDELFASLAAGLRPRGGPLELDATLAVATALAAPFEQAHQSYLELMGGVSYDVSGPLLAFAAAGAGLSDGFGAPDWRVLAGLRVYGGEDEPEPPVALPLAEVDHDADDDGLFDWDDRCPSVPGPDAAFGCPDEDTDGDGIVDRLDACPTEREDVDQFEDGDGCPDPDDDADGVLDADDRCRREAGTDAGCPAKIVQPAPAPPPTVAPAPPARVRVGATKLEITGKIYFDTGSDRIQSRSFELLEEIAAVIVAHPELRRIVVEGHTDSQGSDTTNLALSDRRAAAVRQDLVKRGVDPERLSSIGYGETRPVASNDTREGRAENRRVEFVIDPNP